MLKIAVIKKLPNGKYRVESKSGKNLGTYDSKADAEDRLKQIEMFKHMKKKSSNDRVDLSKIENFSFSAVMRKLRKQLSQELLNEFLSAYKFNFDNAIVDGLQKPETLALTKALLYLNKSKKIKISKDIIKEAALSELGDANQVGQYLASMIRFLMQRISAEKRPGSINTLKHKIYNLNERDISQKKMPASSGMGQSITLVKHILFGHDPRYVRDVLNNIIRLL